DGGTKAKANLKLILFTAGTGSGDAFGVQNNNTVKGYCQNVGISSSIIFTFLVEGAGHDRNVWRPSFWNFAQMACARGFADVGNTAVREYTAGHFSIVAMAGNVGVFDLRGKFLKSITATEFSNRARDLAPGSYIVQWQNGNRHFVGKYAVSKDYNSCEVK
ncbi:MAG: hypothetical protein JXA71_17805, partial [Chitinispirillaceae bacterium]|nr:hypothetical protein [Chitinispirillaceae bacterium]